MTLTRLTVGGLRGLRTDQTIDFAEPSGVNGSGLTLLVGSNNSGKSTFLEAIGYACNNPWGGTAFAQGKRNYAYGDRVSIKLEGIHGETVTLSSVSPGSSETNRGGDTLEVFLLPARRAWGPFFNKSIRNRSDYAQVTSAASRTMALPEFQTRLFAMEHERSRRAAFDDLLQRIVGSRLNWSVDLHDSGQYFLKFQSIHSGGAGHTSEGLGEGMVSLFVVLDALHDSEPGSTIVIDEPELSLHPQYQRRLRNIISEFASDRQIVYATHSPYLVSWDDLAAGAKLHRVFKNQNGVCVASPQISTIEAFMRTGKDNVYNPHVLGIDATEMFFLDGAIVVTEGQEDVVVLRRALSHLNFDPPWSYLGWGVGGFRNMRHACALLGELGYPAVIGILDGDQPEELEYLTARFPEYCFAAIPADDIRDKRASTSPAKLGLTDSQGHIKPQHLTPMQTLLDQLRNYVEAQPNPERP